jgi:hypothetical protein
VSISILNGGETGTVLAEKRTLALWQVSILQFWGSLEIGADWNLALAMRGVSTMPTGFSVCTAKGA